MATHTLDDSQSHTTGTVLVSHDEGTGMTLAEAQKRTQAMGIEPVRSIKDFAPSKGSRKTVFLAIFIIALIALVVAWAKSTH